MGDLVEPASRVHPGNVFGDPHARERAVDIARAEPPSGVSAGEAEANHDVLDGIGDTCPECLPGI